MQSIFAFLGRLFISCIFIFSAVQDILQWNTQEEYVVTALSSVLSSGKAGSLLIPIISFILPKLSIFFAVSIFIKLLGGICVLFKWKVKFGAFLLLLFLIPVTIIMHDFWDKEGASQAEELVQFWKNVAIAGGLFTLLAYGGTSDKNSVSSEKKNV